MSNAVRKIAAQPLPEEQVQEPKFRRGATLVFLVAILIVARGLSLFLAPLQEKVPFDPRPISSLKRQRPEVVLIGNSLLRTRIETKRLSKLIGRRVGAVAQHGSMSARWYLFLKNYVSTVHPRKVVIFFRDDELTRPKYRTEGRYHLFVEAASREQEPLLREKLNAKDDFPFVRGAIERLFPTSTESYRIQDNALSGFLTSFLGQERYLSLHKYQKPFFELTKLRSDLVADDAERDFRGRFTENVERSFLPEYFRLAKEQGYSLIFYRVKRRVNYSQKDSPELAQYIRELESYLTKNGALLIDETLTNDVPESFFSDGDHVARRFQKRYTEIFAARMREVLS